MKQKLSYLALAASALVLQACGGSMLGTSDAEDHRLIPEPVEGDPNRPRPSENAPVLTTDERTLLDATGEPVMLRGINLDFGADPMERIESIVPIREVGSNVVRLMLRPDTTEQELETALMHVVENDLIAVLSLWSDTLSCGNDSDALFDAFNNLWMDRWVSVLVQDRFQPHIMVNLASAWGPTGIFNAHSMGYRIYIDNYKALITQFRRNGFNVPLVIDAPGCGQDYNAFLGNRGRELFAADEQENLVLSVHGYGARWRSGSDVAANMRLLDAERLPLLMSEFGDFNAEEDAVRHTEILDKGVGDYAAGLAIEWQSPEDKVGYVAEMNEVLNLFGREVSLEIYFDGAYVDDGTMGLQAYMRDTQGRYANLGWNGVYSMNAGGWTTLRRAIIDHSSLGWAEDDFDLSAVTHIGVELVANGKAPEVGGDIVIDNIKVIEASVPEQLAFWDFEGGTDGWTPASWMNTTVVSEDGAMGLVRGDGEGEVLAFYNGIEGVSYDGDIEVSMRVFIPESYAAETEGLYFAAVSNTSTRVDDEGATQTWQSTNYIGQDDVAFGEWFTVTLQGQWEGGNDIGLQMGSLAGSQEPILFDDITIFGMPEEELALEWGVQYQSDFSEGTDGWAYLAWEQIPATISAEEGDLVILPRLSEVSDPFESSAHSAFALQKNDLNNVENFDLTSERLVVHLQLYFDEAYADAPEDFEFYLFIQDSNWSNHTNIGEWTMEDITPGEWMTVEFEMELPEAFNRNGLPQHFGFQGVNLYGIPDSPIRVGEMRIEGYIPVEVLEEVIDIVDFHYASDFDRLSVDFVEGGLNDVQLLEDIHSVERSKPFHWIAATWIGAAEGQEALNISESADTSVSLTERGDVIVSGKGGLQETAEPANFPGD
ncbi:glycoside hydrolase family 5 protein [Marinimicrobium alkaliphilum]|uniref:hypothetical protein n=1 Tax=Marinimicrobium alkaliphilum TaxID=2202654 RepID=UPI000DB8FC5C|nr:hypothetical protein [Marinimicrobium alkaliphilum]